MPTKTSPPTSPLAAEIGKRDGFALPEEETHLNIIRTAARLQEPFDRLFKQHGVSAPLYNVLRIVHGVGGAGVPSGEIGPQMITPAPDVTRLVDRLETLGLAARKRSEADRRVVLVSLTARGKRLLDRVTPLVEELLRDSLAHLKRGELKAINDLMVRARNAPDAD